MIDYIIIIVIFFIIMICINKYYTRIYYKKNEIEPFINSKLNDLIEIEDKSKINTKKQSSIKKVVNKKRCNSTLTDNKINELLNEIVNNKINNHTKNNSSNNSSNNSNNDTSNDTNNDTSNVTSKKSIKQSKIIMNDISKIKDKIISYNNNISNRPNIAGKIINKDINFKDKKYIGKTLMEVFDDLNDDGRLKYQKNLDNITVLQNNEFKEIGNSYGESKFDTYDIN